MEKFKVPQQLEKADKIFGPISTKQLIVLVVGGLLAYTLYISFAPITPAILHLPPVIIISLFTLAFAFIEVENISFFRVLLVLIERIANPTKRTFSGIPPRKNI